MKKKLIGLFILFCCLFFGQEVSAQKQARDERYVYSRIFENLKHSTVSVLVDVSGINDSGLPDEVSGNGSGFIVDSSGIVVTNKHVVKNARRVRVRFNNADIFDAKIVGVALDVDLAVLKIVNPPPGLESVLLGDSDSLKIGEPILVIGSPLGLDATLTHGIVSAVRRIPEPDKPTLSPHFFIQVDAAINSGNSGGPLVNLSGEAVGVATMTINPVVGYGIGFAIPINVVKQVVRDIMDRKRPMSNWVGIIVSEIDARTIQVFGLKSHDGLFVSRVESGGPGEEAGLKQGFLLIKTGDTLFKNEADWEWFLRNQTPGTKIALTVMRPPYEKEEIVFLEIKEKPAP